MYFPTRSASGLVVARTRLWTEKPVWRQDSKRSAHSGLRSSRPTRNASPHSLSRLAWHDGQNPLVRQESIRSRSSPQSGHLRASLHCTDSSTSRMKPLNGSRGGSRSGIIGSATRSICPICGRCVPIRGFRRSCAGCVSMRCREVHPAIGELRFDSPAVLFLSRPPDDYSGVSAHFSPDSNRGRSLSIC